MKSQMSDLVSMHDVESLFEIMTEDDDWMLQLDAAEGLVELGDKRGLEFLLAAVDTDISEMNDVAQEILESPKSKAMLAEVEAEKKHQHTARMQTGKSRLMEGHKVFRYKAVYIISDSIMRESMFGQGFDIPELNEFGLDGWEVVNILPNLLSGTGGHYAGAYLLLKKELTSKDQAELDEM